MTEQLGDKLREFLKTCEGKDISIKELRNELKIDPNSPAWTNIRIYVHRLVDERIVRATSKDGIFHVVKQVLPVRVFLPGRERRPPVDLKFPKDYDKGLQMDFCNHIIVREGDLFTIGGVKSKGKTTLALNFTAENIDSNPVLMGNEYTVMNEGKFAPAPRFLSRLDKMSQWVKWTNDEGMDKFTLLPVRADYAEHVIPNRINIIDWVNLNGNALYDIGKVLEGIKEQIGRGVAIIILQKGEGTENPRGGQFVRDFSDLELLLDGMSETSDDILLTVKGAKETTSKIVGNTYAYSIADDGTKIIDFREVINCPDCRGKRYNSKGQKCERCFGKGKVDK